MAKRRGACVAALLFLSVMASHGFAVTATSLASFEGIEDSGVRYYPGSGQFVNDGFANVTSPSSGVFRMMLRYHNGGEWWDGDGDKTDRGRAEVKGLGPYQRANETYDFISAWRTSANWHGTGRFSHIFQLFGVNGSSSTGYMVQMKLNAGNTGSVSYFSDSGQSGTARSFTHPTAAWTTSRIRVRAATSGGICQLSQNGDAAQGPTNIGLYQEGDGYRPKWGLYRGFDPGMGLSEDEYIEHSNVQSNKITSSSTPTPAPRPTITPTPTPTGAPATPTPCTSCGGYYRIMARHSAKAMVVQSASTANSADVIQWSYGGSQTNDEWELRDIGGGYYRLINRHSGKDLTVQSASTAEGADIFQYAYGGAATNDEWAVVDVGGGYRRITSRHSGKSAEVSAGATTDGADVVQRSYSGASHQQWQLIAVP